MLRRVDLPQLLDADAPGLRIAALVQAVAGDHLHAEMAARALREQRVLADELDARLEIGGRLSVPADAHVAGRDTAHRARCVIEHLDAREPGEDLDAQRLGLAPEPADDVGEADDVVPVVDEAGGQEPARVVDRFRLREQVEAVLAHRRRERRAALLPVGDELGQRPRVHHRAGEDVRAELRALSPARRRSRPCRLPRRAA